MELAQAYNYNRFKWYQVPPCPGSSRGVVAGAGLLSCVEIVGRLPGRPQW